MASNSTIIDDEYCTSMGAYFKKQGDNADAMISDYLRILRTVKLLAIRKGETAEALDAYISYADRLKDQIGNISSSAQTQITNFLAKVDQADQYLF